MILILFRELIDLLKNRRGLKTDIIKISKENDHMYMIIKINGIKYRLWITPEFPQWINIRLPMVRKASDYVKYKNLRHLCRWMIKDAKLQSLRLSNERK